MNNSEGLGVSLLDQKLETMFFLTISFNIMVEVVAKVIKQENKMFLDYIRKEGILFAGRY